MMGKSLLERYLEARDEWELKREEEQAENYDQLEELTAIIENEDLCLNKNAETGLYYVATMDGDAVSEEMDLDGIESWLDDPKFVFPEDDEE